MTDEIEPFLILHKVRGEPAFDVAHQLLVEDGIWWIVTTSGHRAYPIQYWSLSTIGTLNDGIPVMALYQEDWPEDWPDHYTVNREKVIGYGGLLERLGLGKKKQTQPLIRRQLR